MSSSQRRSFVWTALGRGGSVAGFGVSTALVSATLPTADLGAFFVIQGLVALVSVFVAAGEGRTAMAVFAGHSSSAAADVSRQWAPTRRTRLAIGAIGGVVVSLVLLEVLGSTGSVVIGRLDTAYAVGIALVLGWQIVLVEGLRARGRDAVANLHTGRTGGFVTFSVFSGLYGAFLMLGREPTISLALGIFLTAAFVALIHLLWSFRFSPSERASGEELNPAATRGALSVVGAQSMTSAFVQVDILAAGLILGAPALAVYGLARRLAGLLVLPAHVGILALTPAVAKRVLAPDGDGAESQLRGAAGTALALSTAATVGVLVTPGRLLADFGVGDAGEFRLIFAILALGHLTNVWSGGCGTVLMYSPHQRTLLGHTGLHLIGLVGLLGLCALLGLGAVGLAIAASTSVIVRFASLTRLTARLTGVRTDARLTRRRITSDVQTVPVVDSETRDL